MHGAVTARHRRSLSFGSLPNADEAQHHHRQGKRLCSVSGAGCLIFEVIHELIEDILQMTDKNRVIFDIVPKVPEQSLWGECSS